MSGTYYGDFPINHTSVCMIFDSFAASTGAPGATSNFANTDIVIFKDGGTTQRTSANGITVSTSFDSNTGLQMVVIDLSDNTDSGFYAAGHEYSVAVADVTIDSQTVRFWLGSFSVQRAGGVLALLKAGTVKVDIDTIKTNPVVNAGTITFPTTATLASTTNITAGTITTATNLTNAPTSGDLTATMKTSVQTAADAAVTANSLVNAIAGYIDTEVAAIKTQTDKLTFTIANQIDANVLTFPTSFRPGIRKNVALLAFEILMTDSTNHNPVTGLTVSVTRSIDGAGFGAGTIANITEIGNGWYSFDFGAGDLNGTVIGVRATATGADDLGFTIKTSP